MSLINVNLIDGSDLIGSVKFDKVDEDEEVIERKFGTTISLRAVLEELYGNRFLMGSVELNIDFDKSGEILSIEFYSQNISG